MQLVTRPTVQMCAVRVEQLARKSVLPEADLLLLGNGLETKPTLRSMTAVKPETFFTVIDDPFPAEPMDILDEWIISE